MATTDVRHPRFRRSERFADWEWLTDSARYPGTNSDMHWLAWTEDGELYSVDDDGWNFGSPRDDGDMCVIMLFFTFPNPMESGKSIRSVAHIGSCLPVPHCQTKDGSHRILRGRSLAIGNVRCKYLTPFPQCRTTR